MVEVVVVAEIVEVAEEEGAEEEEEENTEGKTVFEISCISIPAQNDFPIPISMMTEESCKICNCVNT